MEKKGNEEGAMWVEGGVEESEIQRLGS